MPDFVGFSVAKYRGVNFTGNWNVEDLNKDGYLGDPTVATKETGEKILEYRVGLMVEFLKQLSKLPPRT
jgi:creatinine amidohydrolase/Fe(II)-dependent formamide hydrolase-like protein